MNIQRLLNKSNQVKQPGRRHHGPSWSVLICMMSLWACQPVQTEPIAITSSNDSSNDSSNETAPEMLFEQADAGALTLSVKVRATVVPYQQFAIHVPIGGMLLAHQLIEGQRISKGEMILQLDSEDQTLDVEEAQGRLEQATMAYQLERTNRLRAGDTLTENQDRMLRAQVGLLEAQVRYDRAQRRLQQTVLRAPFSGILSTGHRLVPGSWLNAGERYGHLIQYDQVYLTMEVFAKQLADIQRGDAVLVEPLTQPCTVISTAAMVQTDTGTGRVVARCKNPAAQLLPGMQTEAVIQIEELRGRVRLPRRAVVQRDTAMVVFRLRGDRIEWVYVHPRAMNDQWVILSEGELKPGDTIAVDRHFTASHDARVRPLFQERRD